MYNGNGDIEFDDFNGFKNGSCPPSWISFKFGLLNSQ